MENLSFIAIADIHLGNKLFNFPELERDLKDLFVKACTLAIDKKVKYLVIVGDLYDHNKPTPDIISFVRNQVFRLEDYGIKVVGIAGDHDKVLNGETWVAISGIRPVDLEKRFAGCNYSDNPEVVLNYLRHKSDKELVEWIFLHGQVPSLFPYTEDKKKIDLIACPILKLYPKLKGLVLGDIHKPLEDKLVDGDRIAYMGYCGSLGNVKSDETDYKAGLLFFNGKELSRLPFEQERDIVKITLDVDDSKNNQIQFYYSKYKNYKGKKPLFIVEYNQLTKKRLESIKCLYEIGLVHSIRKSVNYVNGSVENKAIVRSELSNSARISAALKDMSLAGEVHTLAEALLTSDEIKTTLDNFKKLKLG